MPGEQAVVEDEGVPFFGRNLHGVVSGGMAWVARGHGGRQSRYCRHDRHQIGGTDSGVVSGPSFLSTTVRVAVFVTVVGDGESAVVVGPDRYRGLDRGRTGTNLLSCPSIPRNEGHIYCDRWTPFIMNEYLKRMIKSPRNPNAESETCEESAGVFRFDDWVVIYGSYGERDLQFELVCNCAAKGAVWTWGLPRPDRFHGEDNWAIIIEACGCADEVLHEMKRIWDGMLVDYDNWLALDCDDDECAVS